MYRFAYIINDLFNKWIENLQREYNDISFPNPITSEALPDNVYMVEILPLPTVDITKKAIHKQYPEYIDSKWVLGFEVVDLDTLELQELIRNQSDIARVTRDHLLSTSDWTQLPDSIVNKEAWALYRQSLRDVPQQEGFPLNIVWPQKPE